MDDRFRSYRDATALALLQSPSAAPRELREAVAQGAPPPELATLVEKIRSHAYTVTDADVSALKDRYTDDQLFEIIVAAAFGAAQERLAALRRALENA